MKETKLTLRVEKTMYKKAVKRAKEKFMSFNGYVNSLIDADLYEYYDVKKNEKF